MTDTFASGHSTPFGGAPDSPQTAPDVTGTLAELERKLRELEQELSSIGQRRRPEEDAPRTEDAPPVAVRDAPERPAPANPLPPREPVSRLIDEAVEPPPPPVYAESTPTGPIAQAITTGAPTAPELTGLAELRLFRERLERFAHELSEDFDQVLERVRGDFTALPASSSTPSLDDTLFEGRVELGVGPFYDIGSLSGFERQVAKVPYASDVAVRRFEASHAVLDLNLGAPVALVSELRTLLSIGFSVREISGSRLMLSFDDN